MLRKFALSMEVSSKEAPRASAPSKLVLTYRLWLHKVERRKECNNNMIRNIILRQSIDLMISYQICLVESTSLKVGFGKGRSLGNCLEG